MPSPSEREIARGEASKAHEIFCGCGPSVESQQCYEHWADLTERFAAALADYGAEREAAGFKVGSMHKLADTEVWLAEGRRQAREEVLEDIKQIRRESDDHEQQIITDIEDAVRQRLGEEMKT